MFNNDLKEAIKVVADQLSFLPDEQIIDTIADMIEDLLPFAIFSMQDDLIKIDDSRLPSEEYHERRRWGKDRATIEAKIEHRREVLEHLRISKAAIPPKEIAHGSMVTLVQQKAQPNMMIMESSLRNVVTENETEGYSSHSFKGIASKTKRYRDYELNYTIDDSVVEKMTRDHLFLKFCSSIELTARNFVAQHMKESAFELKERTDVEFPDWNRTILFIQFPRTGVSDKLWSILSDETRNDLNKISNQLPNEEQTRFRDYVTNFNVQMVL